MKNLKLGLIILSIFAVPLASIIPVKGADVWYGQYLALFVCFCLGCSLVLWQFNKWISIFTLLCLYSVIFPAEQHPRSILLLIQLYLSCFAMYVISRVRQRNILLWSIVGITIIQGGWVVLQYFNLDPIFNLWSNPLLDDTVGFSGSHNQIGLFLGVTSPLILSFCPILFPLSVFGVWCSTTSFAWVGLIVSNLFLSYHISRRVCVLLVIGLILSSIMFFTKFENVSDGVIQERKDLWVHTIEAVNKGEITMYKKQGNQEFRKIIKFNPWFGYGLGNFMRISPYSQTYMTRPHKYSHAHNDYIEVLAETGRIGFLSLMAIIVNFFYTFWKAKKTKVLLIATACLLAHMVTALGIFTVHTATSGMLLILFGGIFYGEVKNG